MLESLAAAVLNRVLGAYIDGVEPEQLRVGLLAGAVELENVRLRAGALDSLGLPLDVRRGTLGTLSLHIPWRALGTEPVRLIIRKLDVLAVPANEQPYDAMREAERAAKEKRAAIDAAELIAAARIESESRGGVTTFSTSFAAKLVENLELTIEDVHIRVDARPHNRSPLAVGLSLSSVSARTADAEWRAAFVPGGAIAGVLRKIFSLEGLAVYWDVSIESESHAKVIQPIAAEARLTHKNGQSDLKLIVPSCGVNVTIAQWEDILHTLASVSCARRAALHKRVLSTITGDSTIAKATELQPIDRLRYGFHVVLDRIRQRWACRTWPFVMERAQKRKEYVARLLAVSPPKRSTDSEVLALEESLEANEIIRARDTVRKAAPPQSAAKTSGLSSSLWRWLGYSAPPEDAKDNDEDLVALADAVQPVSSGSQSSLSAISLSGHFSLRVEALSMSISNGDERPLSLSLTDLAVSSSYAPSQTAIECSVSTFCALQHVVQSPFEEVFCAQSLSVSYAAGSGPVKISIGSEQPLRIVHLNAAYNAAKSLLLTREALRHLRAVQTAAGLSTGPARSRDPATVLESHVELAFSAEIPVRIVVVPDDPSLNPLALSVDCLSVKSVNPIARLLERGLDESNTALYNTFDVGVRNLSISEVTADGTAALRHVLAPLSASIILADCLLSPTHERPGFILRSPEGASLCGVTLDVKESDLRVAMPAIYALVPRDQPVDIILPPIPQPVLGSPEQFFDASDDIIPLEHVKVRICLAASDLSLSYGDEIVLESSSLFLNVANLPNEQLVTIIICKETKIGFCHRPILSLTDQASLHVDIRMVDLPNPRLLGEYDGCTKSIHIESNGVVLALDAADVTAFVIAALTEPVPWLMPPWTDTSRLRSMVHEAVAGDDEYSRLRLSINASATGLTVADGPLSATGALHNVQLTMYNDASGLLTSAALNSLELFKDSTTLLKTPTLKLLFQTDVDDIDERFPKSSKMQLSSPDVSLFYDDVHLSMVLRTIARLASVPMSIRRAFAAQIASGLWDGTNTTTALENYVSQHLTPSVDAESMFFFDIAADTLSLSLPGQATIAADIVSVTNSAGDNGIRNFEISASNVAYIYGRRKVLFAPRLIVPVSTNASDENGRVRTETLITGLSGAMDRDAYRVLFADISLLSATAPGILGALDGRDPSELVEDHFVGVRHTSNIGFRNANVDLIADTLDSLLDDPAKGTPILRVSADGALLKVSGHTEQGSAIVFETADLSITELADPHHCVRTLLRVKAAPDTHAGSIVSFSFDNSDTLLRYEYHADISGAVKNSTTILGASAIARLDVFNYLRWFVAPEETLAKSDTTVNSPPSGGISIAKSSLRLMAALDEEQSEMVVLRMSAFTYSWDGSMSIDDASALVGRHGDPEAGRALFSENLSFAIDYASNGAVVKFSAAPAVFTLSLRDLELLGRVWNGLFRGSMRFIPAANDDAAPAVQSSIIAGGGTLETMRVMLLDDSAGFVVPFVDITASSILATIERNDSMTRIDVSTRLSANAYNVELAAWEPILEPWVCRVVHDGASRSTTLDADVGPELVVVESFLRRISVIRERIASSVPERRFMNLEPPYHLVNMLDRPIALCSESDDTRKVTLKPNEETTFAFNEWRAHRTAAALAGSPPTVTFSLLSRDDATDAQNSPSSKDSNEPVHNVSLHRCGATALAIRGGQSSRTVHVHVSHVNGTRRVVFRERVLLTNDTDTPLLLTVAHDDSGRSLHLEPGASACVPPAYEDGFARLVILDGRLSVHDSLAGSIEDPLRGAPGLPVPRLDQTQVLRGGSMCLLWHVAEASSDQIRDVCVTAPLILNTTCPFPVDIRLSQNDVRNTVRVAANAPPVPVYSVDTDAAFLSAVAIPSLGWYPRSAKSKSQHALDSRSTAAWLPSKRRNVALVHLTSDAGGHLVLQVVRTRGPRGELCITVAPIHVLVNESSIPLQVRSTSLRGQLFLIGADSGEQQDDPVAVFSHVDASTEHRAEIRANDANWAAPISLDTVSASSRIDIRSTLTPRWYNLAVAVELRSLPINHTPYTIANAPPVSIDTIGTRVVRITARVVLVNTTAETLFITDGLTTTTAIPGDQIALHTAPDAQKESLRMRLGADGAWSAPFGVLDAGNLYVRRPTSTTLSECTESASEALASTTDMSTEMPSNVDEGIVDPMVADASPSIGTEDKATLKLSESTLSLSISKSARQDGVTLATKSSMSLTSQSTMDACSTGLLRISRVFSDPTLFVAVSYSSFWPFLIRNTCAVHTISVQQRGSDISHSCRASATLHYAWDEPVGQRVLVVRVGASKAFNLDVSALGKRYRVRVPRDDRPHSDRVVVDIAADGPVVVLRFSDDDGVRGSHHQRTSSASMRPEIATAEAMIPPEEDASVADNSMVNASDQLRAEYIVRLPSVGISVAGGPCAQEILYATLRDVSLRHALSDAYSTWGLTIGWAQIDNQLFDWQYPLFLYPTDLRRKTSEQADDEPPFISLGLIRVERGAGGRGFTHYRYCAALIQEFTVELGEELMRALIALHTAATAPEGTPPLPPPLAPKPMAKFEAARDESDVLFFEVLQLHPIKANLTLAQAESAGDSANTSFLMSLGVTDAPLKLNALIMENVLVRAAELSAAVAEHYKREATGQVYSVLVSADAIGNPMGLVSSIGAGVTDLFYEPYQGFVSDRPADIGIGIARGTSSLVRKAIVGVSGTFAGVTGTLARALSAVSMDKRFQQSRRVDRARNRPAHIGAGLTTGMLQALRGFKSGITGVVSKPVAGARQQGVSGFFRGVGVGLVGLVAKPISGLADLAASLSEGIRNAADERFRIIVQERVPRVILADGLVGEYDIRAAIGQSLLADAISGTAGADAVGRSEFYLGHVDVPVEGAVAIVSTRRIVVVSVERSRRGVSLGLTMQSSTSVNAEPASESIGDHVAILWARSIARVAAMSVRDDGILVRCTDRSERMLLCSPADAEVLSSLIHKARATTDLGD